MKVSEFNKLAKYSEGSGVISVVDKRVKMILNEFGVYEEKVEGNDDFELSPLVQFVSPNFNTEVNETDISSKLFSKVEEIKYDERIGYYKSLYIGHVLEGDFRENGSSGGMGTWICKELFEKKMIDGVIHVKQNLKEDNNILFSYQISRSLEEIKEGAKTKYYPVEFSKVIEQVKKIPGKYAIIGIPSFIMAIRLLAETDQLIRDRIVFAIGLICGHQKSSKFAESLAWQVGIKPGNLESINFRKKLPNQPANRYGIELSGRIDGKSVTIVKPASEFIGQNWGQGFFKTVSSDFTDDVMNETADITLGDAWLPEYTTDHKGNNVVIVRNASIDLLIKDAINENRLNLSTVDKDIIVQSQKAHYRHTHDELCYRLYKKDVLKEWRPVKRVKASNSIPSSRKRVQDLREEISMQSHISFKKAYELDNLDIFKEEMIKLTRRYNNIYKINNIREKGLVGIMKVIIRKLRETIISRLN